MGLVQLFREVPYPDLMARHLLDAALADFRESGHHHLMMLVAQREHARRRGFTEEIETLDAKILEHLQGEQFPRRWDVDFLFSRRGYETYGDPLLAVWAAILIEICTLEQHWEGTVLGQSSENPALLPGFHSDEAVRDAAWLEEARQSWTGDLAASVLADAARVLAVVVLVQDPDDLDQEPLEPDQHDVYPEETADAQTSLRIRE